MERNRDTKRSTTAAMNGGAGGAGVGLSRRRQRNGMSSFKESHDDAGIESPETSRLRDRGLRKDRHRDGSNRRKRRRRDRLLHGSIREEGEESSEESIDDDEEDEDEEEDMAVRHRPDNLTASSSSSPHQLQQNLNNHHYNHQHLHHHQQQQRKNFAPAVGRPPAVWTADEMIGVAVPRKTRSASVKRSHEYSAGGVAVGGSAAGSVEVGAGTGGGEQPARQASTSPSRMSPASASQISPASSNASIRKKMKPLCGSKHKPPKTATKSSPSSTIQDDLEIEVAEVLYGLTRQFHRPAKQDNHKSVEPKDGASGNEIKSRVSMPSPVCRSPASHPSSVPPSNSIPKRKKPRAMKYDEESTTSPAGTQNVTSLSSAAKLEPENAMKTEASPPQAEKIAVFASEIGASSTDMSASPFQAQEPAEPEKPQLPDSRLSEGLSGSGKLVGSQRDILASKVTPTSFDASLSATLTSKNLGADIPREEKFKFDLMAPPAKLSPDAEESNFDEEHKTVGPEIEMGLKTEKKDDKTVEKLVEKDEARVEKLVQKDFDLKKQVNDQSINFQLDLKKISKDDAGGSNLQFQKQQSKTTKVELKNDKSASTTSINMPMTVGTWPGGFPSFGYMGQIPSLPPVTPVDGAAGPSNALQPPAFFPTQPRPKRCATHCFIAQTIHHHQKLARMNPFWSAAAGITSMYGAKPYGLNIFPNSEAALFGSPMQGSYPGKIMGSLHENKGAPMVAAAYSAHNPKDKVSPASNVTMEVSQMKQPVLPHMSQTGTASSMLHGPALIFPFNQQQAAVAAAGTANQTGATKFTLGVSSSVPLTGGASTSATGGSTNSGSATPMNLSFANLSPSEAQYLAFLQNNAYSFPLAHVAGAPPFRGINPAQALSSFYPSHMVHSSQIHLQQQQPGPPHPSVAQQSHQKPSTSNESSSYLKHPQQSQNIAGGVVGAGSSSHGLPATHQRPHSQPQSRQQESNKATEDNPSTPESRASQVHKGLSGQNFNLPMHHQNFASMPTAAPGAGNGGGHGSKQQMYHLPQQKQNTKNDISSPQTFTIPFASFNGMSTAATGLDFSSMVPNHVIFQSHSETSRQGYHQIATSASTASQATQQNKVHNQTGEQGKSVVRESINGKVTNADERKMMSSGKPTAIQNSLIFTKSDGESLISSSPCNNVLDSTSQTFNLIQAPANGSKLVNHPPGSVVANSNSADVASVSISTSQQHQHLLQLQKHQQHQQQQQQQQQQLQQLQHQQQQLSSSRPKTSASSNLVSVYSDRLPGGPGLSRYPQTLTGFPQPLTQGGSSHPSAQAKACNRRTAPPSASPAPTPGKANLTFQQQSRSTQQPISAQSHQMQTPFSMNSLKMVASGGQHLPGGSGNPSSVAAMAFSSPSNPVSKNAGGSQAPPMSKPGSAKSSVPLPQQSSPKQSSVSSGSRSSPASNMPSVLGHPQNSSASNSSNKVQQQQQQQQSQQPQKQQPFQAQVFFSNPYMQQHHSLQSNVAAAAAAAGYYQKRSEQYTQQHSQQPHQLGCMTGSTGMLAISSVLTPSCASSASDQAKVMEAVGTVNSMKVPSVMQATQLAGVAQSASGSPRPLIPASFPFVPMPVETGKATSEQNPAAGGDNLHSCWQPEKK